MNDVHAEQVLERHRRIWSRKPVLRRIYNEEFFALLLAHRQPGGISIEVGAGPGFFKQLFPEVISTDLIFSPWLDTVADAQRLPFASGRIQNVFGVDTLHHMASPLKFLRECARVLLPGGRLLLAEPWVTPFSYLIYRYLHQEDCDLSADLWEATDSATAVKRAFDGNQAIPYLLYGPRGHNRTAAALPELRPIAVEPFCLFAYLFSFGFKRPNLLPAAFYPLVAACERATLPLWRRAAALRVLLVLEKTTPEISQHD
jgi:SAM-dependent methyltransferase